MGFDGHAIELSLRHNRPRCVDDEQYYLDSVCKLMEAERELERFVMENMPLE
jgi:hypothetical protein